MSTGTHRSASLALRSDGVSRTPDRSAPRAGRWTIAAALLALAAGCGGGAGSGSSAASTGDDGGNVNANAGTGNQVAILELAQPSIQTFVLHGTIPVPKGTFPRTDGKAPFSIQDWDGSIVPTQVEIVTRYPDDTDGADVVEVLGRVHSPPNGPPGARLQYSIVDDPHMINKFDVTKPVLTMLSQPGTVMLVAQDVFGNSYNLDLVQDARLKYSAGNLRQLRKGDAASQFRTYGVLLPTGTNIGPPSGALPHLMGVHAYITCWAKSDVMSVDLRVSSGTSGLDPSTTNDDPMGPMYFRSLELWVKKGWTCESEIADSAQGTTYDAGTWTAFPIVGARADGKMHELPEQGQFNRRLALCPTGKESEARAYAREEHIGFARRGTSTSGAELYSWWNPQTARYFPQRHRLPELDHLGAATMRGKHATCLNKVSNLIATGAADVFPYPTMGAMGWAYPYGAKYGGMTGGQEIFMLDGLTTAEAASNDGYRLTQVTHRMSTDRQPITLFNKDGDPTKLPQWILHGSQGDYVNFFFFLTLQNGPDPFGMSSYPKFQESYVTANGKAAPYKANIESYKAIDYQHYIRYTRSPKVLTWLGNDALSKDDLWMCAELFRMWYHDLPTNPAFTLCGGLLADIHTVNSHPGCGLAFGRCEGWGIDTMSAVYSFADAGWRQEARPWFQKISDVVSTGQIPCNGFVMRAVNSKWVGGLFQARQAFEETISQNGMRSALESVLRDVDPARAMQTEDVLRAGALSMISSVGWNPSAKAPWGQTAVMPLNQWTPYCQTLPPGGHSTGVDKYYTWTSFAYGLELTGDPTLAAMADQMAGGNVVTVFENAGFKDLENRGALLATCQQSYP